MSTAAIFLILYLIPVLSFAGTIGTYMLLHGESLSHPLINVVLLIVASGFIVSSYLSVKLISKLVSEKVMYFGIVFYCISLAIRRDCGGVLSCDV
ncbi:hypothetical protein [Photobacterium angustum]|uniref:hypothetical protein n=1 Tax=Photobacterium angustum TaxID=661 RepID=UPI000B0D3080|nr:hypothetical protein [Photobacterium angustum]